MPSAGGNNVAHQGKQVTLMTSSRDAGEWLKAIWKYLDSLLKEHPKQQELKQFSASLVPPLTRRNGVHCWETTINVVLSCGSLDKHFAKTCYHRCRWRPKKIKQVQTRCLRKYQVCGRTARPDTCFHPCQTGRLGNCVWHMLHRYSQDAGDITWKSMTCFAQTFVSKGEPIKFRCAHRREHQSHQVPKCVRSFNAAMPRWKALCNSSHAIFAKLQTEDSSSTLDKRAMLCLCGTAF